MTKFQINAMITTFVTNIAITTALVTEKDVLLTFGKIFGGNQWLIHETIQDIAQSLARNGIFTAQVNDFVLAHETLPSICLYNRSNSLKILKVKIGFHRCKWIVTRQFTEDEVEDVPLYFSDVVLFVHSVRRGVEVSSVYRVSPNNVLVVEKVNVTHINETTVKELKQLVDVGKRTLKGSKLKVLRSYVKDCSDSELDPYDTIRCLHEELMSTIALFDNIQLDVVDLSPDYDPHFAYTLPNGSYSGLFLELLHRNVDLSTGSFVAVPDRLRDFSFAWPTFHFRSGMFIKDSLGDISWASYTEPLEPTVWVAIATCFSVAALLLVIAATKEKRLKSNLIKDVDAVEAVFNGLQILSFQGINNMPSMTAFRIIYISLLLCAITLLPAYSGSLVSYLTVRKTRVPFTTLNQFLDDGSYTLNTLFDGFVSWYLRFYSLVDLSKVLVPIDKTPEDDTAGFNSVCDGRNTYVSLSVGFKPGNKKLKCHIVELPMTLLVQYFGFGLPKRSPLTEYLNQRIHNFRTLGILHKMNKRLYQQNINPHEKELTGMSGRETAPIFIILIIGTTCSIFLLIFELARSRNKAKSLKPSWQVLRCRNK